MTPAILIVAIACLSPPPTAPIGPQQTPLLGEGRRVLFIGNSYTYSQDIPGIVQALADSAGGDKLAVASVVGPDMALIDHWRAGTARTQIARGGWEWVVLQQGPSSVEVNRDSLRLLTRMFADDITAAHALPALFSAWPAESRRVDFPRAIESYELAAADVSGLLLPVARGWQEVWTRDATVRLYADGLHPSVEGAYVSALIIYATLLKTSPVGLPRTLRLNSGGVLSVSAERAALLQSAAAAVTNNK